MSSLAGEFEVELQENNESLEGAFYYTNFTAEPSNSTTDQ